ncbi:RNA pseudouridylate synthase domain containing protein 2 [Perkinsus olseni]|uniref:RNA pseudouridylate synthase domain containing protein 2 n=1 Tax=Perkinsus olseni TaxID=32597 RepID=A0A7J6PW50_PEROL|nr:RNA pseudouridylate synthase domain containing protein 2 [Perkinsus olseni]KAF4755043.1 RNA pseudouridylate synthase domain containing protein 2 [Perkinsus olseni]
MVSKRPLIYEEDGRRCVTPYERSFEIRIKKRWAGKTIAELFADDFRFLGRGLTGSAFRLLRDGDLKLARGRKEFRVDEGHRVAPGESLWLRSISEAGWMLASVENPIPATPMKILMETDEFLAVDKPCGLPVHLQSIGLPIVNDENYGGVFDERHPFAIRRLPGRGGVSDVTIPGVSALRLMLGHSLLLIITTHIGRVLAEEFYGTYCHSKRLFPYPEAPFDTFCADLYQRDEVDVDARLRFSTRNNVEVATPVVPFEWETEEIHTFEVDKLVVHSTELRNATGLTEWLNKAGKLLKIDAKLSPESLRIYPTPSTRYRYKYRLTVAIGKYHLVLDDEEPVLYREFARRNKSPEEGVLAARPRPAVAVSPSEGRVEVGSYEVHGDEALEARFTFDLPQGNGETIDYMRLRGDRVMKVDEGDTDPTDVMVAEMQVWNVQEHTGVRDLALNNIAIEPNGDDRILLHLGVARDGSPAETVELAKVSS